MDKGIFESDYEFPVSGSTPPDLRGKYVDLSETSKIAYQIESKDKTKYTLNDFNCEDTHTYHLKVDEASELGLPIGQFNNSYSRMVLVEEYAKYQEILEDEKKVKFGIAVRWLTVYKSIEIGINISSLPTLVASAQLDYLEASSIFQVLGCSSERITDLMPQSIKLDLESFIELRKKMDSIKGEFWNPDTVIKPTILARAGKRKSNEINEYSDSLVTAATLKGISKGKKYQEFISSSEKYNSRRNKEIISSIYYSILGEDYRLHKPGKENKKQAKGYLKKYNLVLF